MEFVKRGISNLPRLIIPRFPHQRGNREDLDSRDTYQTFYRQVDSLVNHFDKQVGALPPDIQFVHTEAQRILRRYSIGHPEDEEGFRGDLAWMHFYGDEADLQVLLARSGILAESFPDSARRLSNTVIAIRERLGHASSTPLKDQPIALGSRLVAMYGALGVIVGIGIGHYLPSQISGLVVGLSGGTASAIVLFFEGCRHTRNIVARICFFAAGLLMLSEVASLLKGWLKW